MLAADEASYYISIPELPNITSSGWNSFNDGIYVRSGDSAFSSRKQLVVSMDSANDWNLVLSPDKSASIDYYIATSSTDTEAATMFTFSGASIDEGVSQDFGAIISDFSTKPMGTYQDTITFTVEVQTKPTDLSTLTADYTATDGITLTGKLGGNYKISIAAGATVILDSVDISGTSNTAYKWAGITCEGNATIILSGDNIVRGFYDEYPGIFISPDSTLTISGDGKLTASPFDGGGGTYNSYGAGIGGGMDISCGNVVIEGGTINATGGYNAAGIGGGQSGSCGSITITSGVTSVTATKGSSAPCSIGKGYGNNASCGTVTIGGTVYWDGSNYQNGGADILEKDSYTYANLANITSDYTATGVTTLTGTLSDNVKISIAEGATVILDSVDISGTNDEDCTWAGITCEGDATIILSGDNIVRGFYWTYPGIFISPDSTLTISGDGKLTASPYDGGGTYSSYGAGIGGGYAIACGNIVIEGGTITATGGSYAAGIGGGSGASCGTITITSGVTSVTATKGPTAPCSIGKGYGDGASCGTVTIGGTVYWNGSSYENNGSTILGQSTYTYSTN